MPVIALKQTVVTSVEISWSGSTDNVGVTQYNLYKNQLPIASFLANQTSYTDTNILPNTTYVYGISAGDVVNNWSTIRSDFITTMAVSSSSSSKSSVASSAISKSSVASSTSSLASSSKSSASSVAASSSSSSSTPSSALIKWTQPVQRENGDPLAITEIGGYEIRYRLTTDNTYSYVTINDAYINEYTYNGNPSNMLFQIAAFDTNGLYSNFVDVLP